MEEDVIYQLVVGFFTFIQQNLSQITSGNTIQVMREAEQRHPQIMHGVIDSIKNEWSNKLVRKEQEYEQRLQEVETKAMAALVEERKRGDEFEVRWNQVRATHDAKVEEFKAEANAKHEQKIVEERQRITKELEASYAQTVENARNAITAVKKQCDEKVAVEQARFIQLKAEFETYKREMADRITEAAAQNLSLQDQIDDLQDQIEPYR
jgi:hypothetical protein